MKKQYDFSKGQRGKFIKDNAVFHLPIYLNPKLDKEIREYARKKQIETDSLVNEWLKKSIEEIQSVPD